MAAIRTPDMQSHYRLAQEREFFKYFPREHSASHLARLDHASQGAFIPQPSRDLALNSFAQLGAIRLGVQRTLISLFDRTHQHVVAEATPTSGRSNDSVRDDRDQLRLGCCVLSKERALCHLVEPLPNSEHKEDNALLGGSALIFADITNDERLRTSELIDALSDVRFYAAVPIISPRGFTIGAYSVMDAEARTSGLHEDSLQFMQVMAATVMEHLSIKYAAHKSRLAERMIVGLGNFIEGKSTIHDSWLEAHSKNAELELSEDVSEGYLNIQQLDMKQVAEITDQKALDFQDSFKRAEDTSSQPSDNSLQGGRDCSQGPGMNLSQQYSHVRKVTAGDKQQEDPLSTSVELVFSRAANLIRESLGVEGVMFLDANSERFGSRPGHTSCRVAGPGTKGFTSSIAESTDSGSSPRWKSSTSSEDVLHDSTLLAACLGFSRSRTSSINDDSVAARAITVEKHRLNALLQRYPRGKIFTYDASRLATGDGVCISPNISGTGGRGITNDAYNTAEPEFVSKEGGKPSFQHDADHLSQIFPGARSILLSPIWDPDRRRCFAGTLVWTNNPEHVFTFENELMFVSAFVNNIMAEIRRLDVEMAEKAKTRLVHSITHELRTPLHGILGTADILTDTAMNALQHGMVHTIESCGRTLLDTINNLLERTFIDKYQKKPSRLDRMQEEKQLDLPANSMVEGSVQNAHRSENASYSHVKLDAVLEEVTESIFAGYSFYTHPQAPPPALSNSSSRLAGPTSVCDLASRGASQVTVIFDLQPGTEWGFCTNAGTWRRILMNVFGNALKYTPSGSIYIGLKSFRSHTGPRTKSPVEQGEVFDVILTVKDTGKGIGPEFLQNNLFTPFAQEDSMVFGSGLGLSIVHQAVGSLGGSIEIASTKGVGTEVSIQALLTRSSGVSDVSSSDSGFKDLQNHTRGKRMGILGLETSSRSQRHTTYYSSLERLCRDWFGLKVTSVSPLEGEHVPSDFHLVVRMELDCKDVEGRDLSALSKHLAIDGGCSAPTVVICQSPEEAHGMFVAAKNQGQESVFEFISQPCGPRKLARALHLCIKRQLEKQSDRPSPDEPTRWVEMPKSSHLSLDIDSSDSPEERMEISKRPTADTMRGPKSRGRRPPSSDDSREIDSPNTSQTGATSRSNSKDPDSPSPSILLVDDNDLNLQLLCAFTKKYNHEYITAQNGAAAVDTYKAHLGNIRLIILDITMPIMNGFEAAQEIRQLEREHRASMTVSARQAFPSLTIAALTGLESVDAQEEAFRSGIDLFLVKPVRRSELHAILQRME